MFDYIEQDSFLHRRNPVIKLAMIAVITVIVCLSYFPVLPAVTFLVFFFGTWIISILFMISMLLLRGLNEESEIVVRFWIFGWTRRDFVHAVTLGFRILALITMSMGFVLTTRPGDLLLSLIMQCRLSVVHGYAAMAAYRFLPELQEQIDAIHLAQEIRGIPWNKGIGSRFTSPFRVPLPLLCIAARRGERVACAMESRGMGRKTKRTFYKKMKTNRADWLFLLLSVLGYAVIVWILIKFNAYRFSFASIQ